MASLEVRSFLALLKAAKTGEVVQHLRVLAEAEEMVHQLRALAAFPQDLNLFLAPTWWLTPAVTPVSGNLVPSPGLHRHCMHVVHKHADEKHRSYTQK